MTKRATDRFWERLFKWNIRRKLTIASSLVIILAVLMGGVSVWRMHLLARAVDDISLMEQQRAGLLMLAGIVLIMGVVLSWRRFVFQRMISSIAELRQGVTRVMDGDLDHELDIRTGDELEELGNEFNKMVAWLTDLVGSLEERVAERTRDLEDSLFDLEGAAQVARQAASIRDLDKLLDETVHLISVMFGFYHTGIFLIDEAGEYAILQAASSAGGYRMLERGHRLRVGGGSIVGFVADVGVSRIALDVGEDAVHFNNPDLPETRSEMAVPLESQGEIIGVIDVQSLEKGAFTDRNVTIIKTLSDQITLAIKNAQLLKESQWALKELETLYGRRVREAWRDQAAHRPSAYRYTGVSVVPAPSAATPALEDLGHREATVIQEDDGTSYQLAAPIRLRGQRIGSIVLRRSAEQEPWSSEDIALMEEASDQIALALENARLLEDTQRRAAREQMLGEITSRMRETLDMDAILQTALREMGERLGIAEVEVRMGADKTVDLDQAESA
jgi:GAF domain-containing protein/HAMP domain-containing protein